MYVQSLNWFLYLGDFYYLFVYLVFFDWFVCVWYWFRLWVFKDKCILQFGVEIRYVNRVVLVLFDIFCNRDLNIDVRVQRRGEDSFILGNWLKFFRIDDI